MLVLIAAVLVAGCASNTAEQRDSSRTESGAHVAVNGEASDVLVSFASSGERGDLPELVQEFPDLESVLASGLAPFVSAGFAGEHAAASFRVVGAESNEEEILLFAHESLATFSTDGGRLILKGGMSAPVRIRIDAASLKTLAIDAPLDGSEYGSSIDKMMPRWASSRTEEVEWEGELLQQAAAEWAERSNELATLVSLKSPGHSDPHGHRPDVYSLGAIEPSAHGFSVAQVAAPASSDTTPGPGDLEKVSSSSDGRFECYLPLRAWSGLVVHDSRSNRWLHIDGPGLEPPIEDFAWKGTTLLFDRIDVGYSEPRPPQMTIIHVEVDLSRPAIERVVPLGPYTGNEL